MNKTLPSSVSVILHHGINHRFIITHHLGLLKDYSSAIILHEFSLKGCNAIILSSLSILLNESNKIEGKENIAFNHCRIKFKSFRFSLSCKFSHFFPSSRNCYNKNHMLNGKKRIKNSLLYGCQHFK